MHFIVVANDNLAPLGRRIAHALSNQRQHSGAFWSVKHYKDNEAQLDGKQPVIFLGDHDLTASYINVLPEKFQGYGAHCHFEGAKAVLIADMPSDVSIDDLNQLRAVVERNLGDLRRLADGDSKSKAVGAIVIASSIATALWRYNPFGLIAYVIKQYLSARKRRQEYHKLQYAYVLSRFIMEHFKSYVDGIEGC